MTFEETDQVIYILQSNYPTAYAKQTAEQADAMGKLWASCFECYDLRTVLNALKVAIMKKKDFPPNIAEINEEIVKMIYPQIEQMDGEMAWGEVERIIQKYGSYLTPEQQESLQTEVGKDPALEKTIRAVGSLEEMRMCEMNQINTLRAQFIRIYNSYAKRQRDDFLLPQNLRGEIDSIKHENLQAISDVTRQLADKMGMERGSCGYY